MSLTASLIADATSGTTGGTPPVWLPVFSALWAWRGYTRAQHFESANGRRPWGWSPTAWSALCFFTALLGRLLLESAGSRDAKKLAKARPVTQQWTPPVAAPPTYGAVAPTVLPGAPPQPEYPSAAPALTILPRA